MTLYRSILRHRLDFFTPLPNLQSPLSALSFAWSEVVLCIRAILVSALKVTVHCFKSQWDRQASAWHFKIMGGVSFGKVTCTNYRVDYRVSIDGIREAFRYSMDIKRKHWFSQAQTILDDRSISCPQPL
jgi:hypothetical protein